MDTKREPSRMVLDSGDFKFVDSHVRQSSLNMKNLTEPSIKVLDSGDFKPFDNHPNGYVLESGKEFLQIESEENSRNDSFGEVDDDDGLSNRSHIIDGFISDDEAEGQLSSEKVEGKKL